MFNGIWLVATEPLTIQGREVRAGEQFHISRVHSGALLVTGRATILHPQPPPKVRAAPEPTPEPPTTRRRGRTRKTVETPESAADVPETPAASEAVPETPQPADDADPHDLSRQYHRRDLEAEP